MLTSRRLIVAAALIAMPASMATIAQAETAQPAAAQVIDPARLAAARELMTVMRAEEQTRKSIDASMGAAMHGMADRALTAMPQQPGVTNDPEFRAIMQRFMDRMGAQMTTQVEATMPQLIQGITELYARDFTVAQIRDMTAFYRTPTGQAVVDKLPEITAQAGALTQQLLLPSLMASLKPAMQQLQDEMKAWEAKHPELKGKMQ